MIWWVIFLDKPRKVTHSVNIKEASLLSINFTERFLKKMGRSDMAQEVIRPTPILSPQASERFLTIIKNKKKQGRISTPKLDKVIEFVVQKARAKNARKP
jgi:hypothetical protein